ncbi:ORF015 [Spodoptera frugiperda granulovirus]|uniref:DUF919 n=1 Tax=Spodoptera frugiperda granulovirus TaxID=307454 RepID=A0A068FMA5_9BBAC|nr:ORF015 [Spodoptera frugiperda granulovirus]AID68452.1 DUF919 [Spodoptera frugiperda granulovirus]AJK91676.1 ORF015 [Spodoptera frugiperda granulovirus]AXS01034.1 ORF015 [Spodoptera frugiperda granulovirus]
MNDDKSIATTRYSAMSVTDQLDLINKMKRDMIRVTTHHERLARIEKHPQATQLKLKTLRETYLLAMTDLL